MEQLEFENNHLRLISESFNDYNKYLNSNFKIFSELQGPIYQQVSCLILKLYYPSITLTNFILERLLKLALIYNQVGIRKIPLDKVDTVFEEANKTYGTLNLGNSIEQCKSKGLITEAERNSLYNNIREMFRNGFSHADAGKIMVNAPDKQEVVQVNISNIDDIQKLVLNPKVNPTMQYIYTESFARANYIQYFNFVFILISNIEARLIQIDQK